jgi:23S rRNA (guanine2445-N2)-methyltransferase / 23S rRNA (guanine2069-N7)-methyltransferase
MEDLNKRDAKYEFTATASRGTEEALVSELRHIGLQKVQCGQGAVTFSGPLRDGYRACLWSRVASRVLLKCLRQTARDAEELYAVAKTVPWENHIAGGATFAVRFVGKSKTIRDTRFGGLVIKDAIVDRLRELRGVRPSVDPKTPDVMVHVHLAHANATIYIDLSGDPLHIRGDGGRVDGPAPIRENLAAAMLVMLDWPRRVREGQSLVDPFCGSGTIVLEAAGMALHHAPGLARSRWGFTGWSGHNDEVWKGVCSEATEKAINPEESEWLFVGSDIDDRAVHSSNDNALRLGLRPVTRFFTRDASLVEPPQRGGEALGPGLLLTNPPYGERLGEVDDLIPLYGLFGDRLRQVMLGWQTGVLLSDPRLGKAIGLKTSKKHRLFNGPIECRLFEIAISDKAPEGLPKWRQ